MKCNSGIIDRAVRIIVGLILIVLAATEAIGWWGYISLLHTLGLAFLLGFFTVWYGFIFARGSHQQLVD
jgi:uncharacterized membrane protein